MACHFLFFSESSFRWSPTRDVWKTWCLYCSQASPLSNTYWHDLSLFESSVIFYEHLSYCTVLFFSFTVVAISFTGVGLQQVTGCWCPSGQFVFTICRGLRRFLYAHAEFPTWLLDIITVENGLEGLLATSKQLCVYVCLWVRSHSLCLLCVKCAHLFFLIFFHVSVLLKGFWIKVSVCMCVCVCVWERERVRDGVCVSVCVHTSFQLQFWQLPSHSLVHTIRLCVRACVCVCVWDLSKETLTLYPKTHNALLQKNTPGHCHYSALIPGKFKTELLSTNLIWPVKTFEEVLDLGATHIIHSLSTSKPDVWIILWQTCWGSNIPRAFHDKQAGFLRFNRTWIIP